MAVNPLVRGGSFLLETADAASVFTPEDFTEEQLMVAELTEQFVEGEVLPHDDRLESQDFALTVKLLRQMGALGLLGADIPEAYGGSGLDKISSTLITEKLVRASSFALSFGAHVGIGSLPIALFGNEEQKSRYLPKLVTGETIAAYCLTEPASGSDALNARTTAKLNPEGTHYVLNGAKQFITNAGFAGLFIVYAKIDGEKFTAFIVEREYSGVSTGPEEKKMGIKGSSTRPLLLEDVQVPVGNVLGEIGRGHVIAFNILNIGRFKLAAGCAGSAKWALELAVQYGKQRKQFGKPLAAFPLIRKKIADVAVRIYAAESMVYRTAGLIDAAMKPLDKEAADFSRLVAKAVEEYAMECSLNKVFATECLDFAADEGVQIYGGYGYIQEYKIERIYRDSRINRIFEGTNEINRLLIPATLLRKAMKGELPLFQAAERLQQELIAYVPAVPEDGLLAQETEMLAAAKKMFLMAGGMAVSKFGTELETEQEVLEALANMIMDIYAAESALLRAVKVSERDGAAKGGLKAMMAQVFAHEAFARIETAARTAIAAMSDGDKLQTELSVLKKMTRFRQADLIALKRGIASVQVAAGKYVT